MSQATTLQFLGEAAPIERKAARAVYLSYSLFSRVFGKEIFSFRAFGLSVALSTLFFLLALAVACTTTAYLWVDVQSILERAFSFNSKIGPDEVYAHYNHLFGICVVLLSLIAEFFYVSKSRIFFRSIRFETSYLRLLFTVAVDVASTFVMFSLLAPLPIILATYLLGLIFPQIDIQQVAIQIHGPFDPKGWNPHVVAHLDMSDPVSAYFELTGIFILEIANHIREGFNYYHFLDSYPVVSQTYGKVVIISGQTYIERKTVTSGFMFPTTTMLASAFATTAWVILSTCLLLFAKFLCHTYAYASSFLGNMHRRPHLIFWWGILPSIIVFLVGGLSHEVFSWP
jgi:hypothetical protein